MADTGFCRSVMGNNYGRSIALGITLLLILIGIVVGFALGLYYMYVTLKNMGNG